MVKYTRMEENKRVYNEEYDTDEYETLTCECHHLARSKELNGSRRKPFFCIYCKTVYKDKNKLNLHRLEGCVAVNGDGKKTILKIYPVFGKGQRGEIEDILIKHGHMNPRKKPSRAKRKKSATAVKESDTYMEVEMAVQAAHEEQNPLRPQKLKVRGMLTSSREAGKKNINSRDCDMQNSYAHHEQVVGNPSSYNSVAGGQGELQVQMQLTREQVEAQAREVANYMLSDASMVSCPESVPCPGLWHLMQFQLLPSDFPDVKDDSFLQAFTEFVDKGLIDPALPKSYGTWYMERETDASEEEKSAVKLTISRFKLVGGRPDLHARHKENSALRAFLQNQKEWLQYKFQKDTAEKELCVRRERYVKDRLNDYDAREYDRRELALWRWSPLLHLLKSDVIEGVPHRPWYHSDAEQKKIAHAILTNRNRIVSDPPHCPLIVRMFKIVSLYCYGKVSTLSDPVTGLLRETMLNYSTDRSAAPVLKISAQAVLNDGCFLFANLPPPSEAQAEIIEDINVLLHGVAVEREVVVDKVQGFLRAVRQRAAGDMATLHPNEFRVLWCGGDESTIADALKTFMLCLKSREDLDMGWVPFSPGHPDYDSVAVRQARETVLKEVHKLHEQRLLCDKTRLLSASARLQTFDMITGDNTHGLLETSVAKLPSRTTDHRGNGSPSKEDSGDESKLERHSSFSTTNGSGDIELDSRSLHKLKDTGIDVGRSYHRHELVNEPPRKPCNTSPDLNLNLDSNDSYETASPVMKCASTFTSHMADFHVPKPNSPPKIVSVLGVEVRASDPGADRCVPRVSKTSASVSASAERSLENYSRRVPHLFNSPSSFSSTSTPGLRSNTRMNSDEEH